MQTVNKKTRKRASWIRLPFLAPLQIRYSHPNFLINRGLYRAKQMFFLFCPPLYKLANGKYSIGWLPLVFCGEEISSNRFHPLNICLSPDRVSEVLHIVSKLQLQGAYICQTFYPLTKTITPNCRRRTAIPERFWEGFGLQWLYSDCFKS